MSYDFKQNLTDAIAKGGRQGADTNALLEALNKKKFRIEVEDAIKKIEGK